MKVEMQDYGEVTVLRVLGDLDCESVELFQESITKAVSVSRAGIVVDASGVGFIDSVGLERLLWARDYCNENNCQLRLAGLDEICTKILEVTRLDNQFNCFAELAEAAKSFA